MQSFFVFLFFFVILSLKINDSTWALSGRNERAELAVNMEASDARIEQLGDSRLSYWRKAVQSMPVYRKWRMFFGDISRTVVETSGGGFFLMESYFVRSSDYFVLRLKTCPL